ncbi:hypothetical protein K1719_009428 [Acacia pycnantha]|nr:hypothetical protein K1719_009428 [Acacia pycnantha]
MEMKPTPAALASLTIAEEIKLVWPPQKILNRVSRMGSHSQEASSIVAFRNFEEEMRRPGVWEIEQGAVSTAESSRDNLASLYRPPFHLMFTGTFDKAKTTASSEDKWLLVNIQSTKEFSSHMLNRDTWANEAVSQTINTNFIFWQVYDDTTEGRRKVGADSANPKPLDDDDNVELEKSNVLLMGPTGSGMTCIRIYHYFYLSMYEMRT